MKKSKIDKWHYRAYIFGNVFFASQVMWGIALRFSDALGVSPTHGHRILKDLEKRGYVRNYQHGCWAMTITGNEVYKNIHKTIDTTITDVLKCYLTKGK